MPCTHRTHRGPDGLELRKERGTTACLEKAQRGQDASEPEGQRKACKAKAKLLEPQFPGVYSYGGAESDLTWHTGWTRVIGRSIPKDTESASRPVSDSLSGPSTIGWDKGMNGAPEHAASHYSGNHGIACSRMGPNPRPVWRRSSHIRVSSRHRQPRIRR